VGFCAFSLIIENNAQMASVFAAGLSAPQSLPAIFALRISNKHSVVRIMTTIAGRVNSHHTFTGKRLQIKVRAVRKSQIRKFADIHFLDRFDDLSPMWQFAPITFCELKGTQD
jgi:hypothetical protein